MEASDRSVQFAGGTLGRQRHICAFFNSIDEEHSVLRSFIRDGLDRGEKGFHIVDPDLRSEHLKRLAEAGINVGRAIDTGQLEVRAWQDAYPPGDCLNPNAMLALIQEGVPSGAATGDPPTKPLAPIGLALPRKQGGDD